MMAILVTREDCCDENDFVSEYESERLLSLYVLYSLIVSWILNPAISFGDGVTSMSALGIGKRRFRFNRLTELTPDMPSVAASARQTAASSHARVATKEPLHVYVRYTEHAHYRPCGLRMTGQLNTD